jgi:DNA-binding beta-propeller fold protein YncE
VNLEGNYELRVFVVNFDSSTIQIFNPKNGANIAFIDLINVGPGPFAMAFDPFSLEDVAAQRPVPTDDRYDPSLGLNRRYRFAYVASFSQSFVQVIDLDQTKPSFENVVYTLGAPTPPKGTAVNSGSPI